MSFVSISETMDFLKELEKQYSFKSEVFMAAGCQDKAEYDKKVRDRTQT